MEKIYEINRTKYQVQQLKLAQYQQAMGILAQLKLGEILKAALYVGQVLGYGAPTPKSSPGREFDGEIDIESSIQALAKEHLLTKFLALCVVPVNGKYDPEKLPDIEKDMAELEIDRAAEILKDFFDRNEGSVKRALGILGKADNRNGKQTGKKPAAKPA